MNFKKISIFQLLMMSVTVQAYDFNEQDLKMFAASGFVATAVVCTGYIWATSGDSVEQKVQDAQEKLANMPEYETQFEFDLIVGQQESQIATNLKKLHIELEQLSNAIYERLQKDLEVVKQTYSSLYFKSIFGGQEIKETLKKVGEYKNKIQKLLEYFQKHKLFVDGHQIVNEAYKLPTKRVLKNHQELFEMMKSQDEKSKYPSWNYVQKLKKDLGLVENLLMDDNQVKYPQLSASIAQYQPLLQEIKSTITSMETYKLEFFEKLEADVIALVTKSELLEKKIKKLEFEVEMLQLSSR